MRTLLSGGKEGSKHHLLTIWKGERGCVKKEGGNLGKLKRAGVITVWGPKVKDFGVEKEGERKRAQGTG